MSHGPRLSLTSERVSVLLLTGLLVGPELKRGSWACFIADGSLAWCCVPQNHLMILVSYIQSQGARAGER